MSPLGQRISDWLKRYPGMIQGDTALDALAAAHKLCKLDTTTVSVDDFAAALDRMGYRPAMRRGKWVLVLPEKPAGI